MRSFLLGLVFSSAFEFGGSGVATPTLDRVAIPLVPANNLGSGAFTIEFFLKAPPGSNPLGPACSPGADAWIEGHIVLDRDVYGPGDYGDFGVSLMQGRIAFGLAQGTIGLTLCGSSDLRDGLWHHVALVRESSGMLRLFVDGALQGSVMAPNGDVSYRLGRATPWPWDPYLVVGAEKHDAGPSYPSFAGRIAELRLSTIARYSVPFSPPAGPFAPDGATAGLFGFEDLSGILVRDRAGVQDGERRVNAACLPRPKRDAPWRPMLFDDGFEC
ncbi:MAG: hypothetical protein KatS3mg125_0443 [Lysobacterales bacterium]|jgi:hypothetical protein|nr:MAG: hypothetical protein KatS3mg125_0443 [Xanthomonadales bacterium]